MKTADVKIGGEYLTKVGQALVKVMVESESRPLGYMDTRDKPRRFVCKRVDNGTVLPKSRTAAALRPVPVPKQLWHVRANDEHGNVLVIGRTDKGRDFVARVAVHNATVQRHFDLVGGQPYQAIAADIDGPLYNIMLGNDQKGVLHVAHATEAT